MRGSHRARCMCLPWAARAGGSSPGRDGATGARHAGHRGRSPGGSRMEDQGGVFAPMNAMPAGAAQHRAVRVSRLPDQARRAAMLAVALLAAASGTAVAAEGPGAPPQTNTPLKIGIIGTGEIGGALATLWVQAGHEVLVSSRHPDQLKPLAKSLGPRARVGTPREAALFG